MIDKIDDGSLYNKCEFCPSKSLLVYFDTEHLAGTGKPHPYSCCCEKHQMDAIKKVSDEVHQLVMLA